MTMTRNDTSLQTLNPPGGPRPGQRDGLRTVAAAAGPAPWTRSGGTVRRPGLPGGEPGPRLPGQGPTVHTAIDSFTLLSSRPPPDHVLVAAVRGQHCRSAAGVGRVADRPPTRATTVGPQAGSLIRRAPGLSPAVYADGGAGAAGSELNEVTEFIREPDGAVPR
jgi:hypothetical protein